MSSVLDVYYEFNPKLVTILPLHDPIFSSYLVRKGLFSGNTKAMVKAQPTQAGAASYFLDNVIENSLTNDDTEPFEKLLAAMEEFSKQLKAVAGDIRGKLPGGGGGPKVTKAKVSTGNTIILLRECVHSTFIIILYKCMECM